MKLLLDTANLDDIRYFNTYYPIVGVTTNPTILSREGGDVLALLREIREIIGVDKELHVQVTESDYDKVIEEAKAIVNFLGKNTYVKLPISDVGLRATKALSDLGYDVTMTAILTAAQAMLASNAGAAYVAPYVSRLENAGADGVGTVAEIVKIFNASRTDTQILAASFKTAKEVLDVAVCGCHTATVSSDIMQKLSAHTTTDTSIAGFKADWNKAFGDSTILGMIKGK